jgi:hypothetical protein
MAGPFETFVLVEMQNIAVPNPAAPGTVMPQPFLKRIIRTYTDKAVGEEAVALLRDAFAPDHVCQFDLLAIPHVD